MVNRRRGVSSPGKSGRSGEICPETRPDRPNASWCVQETTVSAWAHRRTSHTVYPLVRFGMCEYVGSRGPPPGRPLVAEDRRDRDRPVRPRSAGAPESISGSRSTGRRSRDRVRGHRDAGVEIELAVTEPTVDRLPGPPVGRDPVEGVRASRPGPRQGRPPRPAPRSPPVSTPARRGPPCCAGPASGPAARSRARFPRGPGACRSA